MLTQPWRIDMLGGFSVRLDTQRITRFKSHNATALLAYLALFPTQPHSRDELVALFWPDDELDAARNRFRVMLSSLRSQLEPPDTPPGRCLRADRLTVALQTDALTTDVWEFEEALDGAVHMEDEEAQITLLKRAADAYHGELLPGFLDDWVLAERNRLAERHQQALHRLVRSLVANHESETALTYALQAVQADPLREEACRDVMRLYASLGQPSAARHCYAELERLLIRELGVRPGASTRQLAAQIEEQLGRGVAAAPGGSIEPTLAVAAPAPLRSPEPAGLPVPLTRFFGREPEIAALLARLAGREKAPPRLLTLIGVGGAGKTRLVIETARRWQTEANGIVRFVPLADLSAARQIPAAIAAALRLPLAPGQDALIQICAALASHQTLLVLDNLEHLATEAAPLITALLERAPGLTCLVTSRRSLGIEGEEEWNVAPLPVPAAREKGRGKREKDEGGRMKDEEDGRATSSFPLHPSALLMYPSIQLFVDRAMAVQPDFQITARNAAEVAALCRDLEGIPLALELAAARARVLTPGQMRTHLARRFEFLVNRRAGKDARHRSLYAAIEWSIQLLSPDLRRLFVQLSVFQGGWTLEAAQAVLGESEALDRITPERVQGSVSTIVSEHRTKRAVWDISSLLEGFEQLQSDSLVVADEVAGEMRFRMLESLREFAASQLAPEQREELTARHAAYYVALAEEAKGRLKGREQARWLDRLEQELPNLRAAYDAMGTAPDEATARMALRLTRALWRFWIARGPLEEGRERAVLALAHARAQVDTPLYADALGAAGAMAVAQDDYETAKRHYVEQMAVSRKIGFTQGHALALDNLVHSGLNPSAF